MNGAGHFLLSLSNGLVRVPATEIESHIEHWLGRLACLLGVARTKLWEFSPDGTTPGRQFFYSSAGEARPAGLSRGQLSWLLESLRSDNVVSWTCAPQGLPSEACDERSYAVERGIQAAVCVPVLSSSALFVLVVVSTVQRPEWPSALVFLLRLVADLLVSALARADAEKNARAMEVRHRAVLRALPDLMFVISPEGTYLDYYARDERELMVQPAEFMGRNVDEFLPPDVGRTLRAAHERAMAGTDVVTTQFELAIHGKAQHFETRMVCRADGAVVSIVRNITDDVRRRMENERLRIELAHAGRVGLMGYLTASLAHELRQPIAAVLSNADAARRLLERAGHHPADLRGIVADIAGSSLRAARQIDRVQSLLRKESQAFCTVDLNQVAGDIAKVLESELILRKVRLRLELSPALPAVHGDSTGLQQVLLNLMINGAEAMERTPRPERELLLRTEAVGQGKVRVSIEDRGPGVRPGDIGRLFEPFFSTKPQGIGIGLSIASDIVRSHGACLCVEHVERGGMRFYFELAPK